MWSRIDNDSIIFHLNKIKKLHSARLRVTGDCYRTREPRIVKVPCSCVTSLIKQWWIYSMRYHCVVFVKDQRKLIKRRSQKDPKQSIIEIEKIIARTGALYSINRPKVIEQIGIIIYVRVWDLLVLCSNLQKYYCERISFNMLEALRNNCSKSHDIQEPRERISCS